MMRNSRVPISKPRKKLSLSFKALDGWPTFDQCERLPRFYIWQKRKLKLSVVSGLIWKLEQEQEFTATSSSECTRCFCLVCLQLWADSWLKDAVDHETQIQTGKLKGSGLSHSYLGRDPSTNVSSRSLGRNLSHQFMCKLLSHRGQGQSAQPFSWSELQVMEEWALERG